ncbi:MarR family winged helix-turn-helix transcriptional regulator [Prescottella agglutinans]|uniref:DNA-binding MarR family transcriptional regulator n=1 Tax=Prescottella agglutinans TaxID=1644129 RepID=A0ABT6M983_9NOCA|nr:MarR family transcriptional regulator [Prescottella agglutinans]MDH6280867.1 DNA-binding MarR family transcriptional regulator [Prescottella agglutinans]
MPDTPDVSDALGRAYLLAEHLSTTIAAGTRTFGLTTARTRALLCVLENPPMTQRDMAKVLRCSTRQVTALVDALEQSGHLRREAHPTDRRAHIVALTDRGRSDAGHIQHLREQAAQDLFDGVPAADLDAFVRVADVLITRRRQQASPDAER